MNNIELSYHRDFPRTPMTRWIRHQFYGWQPRQTKSGQWMRPTWGQTPFSTQRKLWCRLEVHFRGVTLFFTTPLELDHFIAIMQQKHLPSGPSLVPGRRIGRPNNHWLSRLPAKAKPWKFRKAVCAFLNTKREVKKFREFYQSEPIQTHFEGYYPSFHQAASQKYGKS